MRVDEEFEVGMVMHEIASATTTLWTMTIGQKCKLDRLGLNELEKAHAALGVIILNAHKDAA